MFYLPFKVLTLVNLEKNNKINNNNNNNKKKKKKEGNRRGKKPTQVQNPVITTKGVYL